MTDVPHDPITGEVLTDDAPRERAADGRPMHPIASKISQFIAFLGDGRFDQASAGELTRMIEGLRAHATSAGGKAKGAITVKIEVTLEDDMFMLTPSLTTKLPPVKHARGVMFATDDGRFTPNKPNQHALFGVRSIDGPKLRNQG